MRTKTPRPSRLWLLFGLLVLAVAVQPDTAASQEDCTTTDRFGIVRRCTFTEEFGACIWEAEDSMYQCWQAGGFWNDLFCVLAYDIDCAACGIDSLSSLLLK